MAFAELTDGAASSRLRAHRDQMSRAARAGRRCEGLKVPIDRSWAVVRRIQRGEPELFGELYAWHKSAVMSYFLSRNLSVPTSEDLTSETFVRAFSGIRSITYRGKDVRAWFMTIAKNIARDHFKRAQVTREISTDVPPELRTSVAPEEQALTRAQFEEVVLWLGELSPDQFQCLLHRRVLGLSVTDTAARMNRTPEAVRALLYRADRHIRAIADRFGA